MKSGNLEVPRIEFSWRTPGPVFSWSCEPVWKCWMMWTPPMWGNLEVTRIETSQWTLWLVFSWSGGPIWKCCDSSLTLWIVFCDWTAPIWKCHESNSFIRICDQLSLTESGHTESCDESSPPVKHSDWSYVVEASHSILEVSWIQQWSRSDVVSVKLVCGKYIFWCVGLHSIWTYCQGLSSTLTHHYPAVLFAVPC